MRDSIVERGLLEIYRFVPLPLLERFDPETADMDEFFDYVAKARFLQDLERDLLTRAIRSAFSE